MNVFDFDKLTAPKKDMMMKTAKALANADRIIVVPEEKEKVTQSGIHRSQTAKGEDETEVGLVVAAGEGYTTEYGHFIPTRSKVGDRVLLDRFAGVKIRVDKKGKILASHFDVTDDLLPVRIVRQDAILWTFPDNWNEMWNPPTKAA